MAELFWQYDAVKGEVTFSGSYSYEDFCAATKDRFDRMQLRDRCETAHDFLLDAELIFRRAHEARSPTEQDKP